MNHQVGRLSSGSTATTSNDLDANTSAALQRLEKKMMADGGNSTRTPIVVRLATQSAEANGCSGVNRGKIRCGESRGGAIGKDRLAGRHRMQMLCEKWKIYEIGLFPAAFDEFV